MDDKLKVVPQHLKGWLAGGKSAIILVTGITGAGKSALINGIVGDEVAKEGHELDRATTKVESFKYKYQDVDITIWDSPGLQDGLDKEEEYVKDMQSKGCANSDLFLYCTRMNEERLRQDDIDAIRKLTIGLGSSIWENALFVLTCANRVEPPPVRGEKMNPVQKKEKVLDHFKKRLGQWKEKLHEAVVKAGVDAKIAAHVSVVPAGYENEIGLPDRDNWLSPLWYASILRMKEQSQPALLKANLHRIKLPDQIKPEDFEKPLHEQPIVYIPTPVKYGAPPAALSIIGMVVGGLIAGPVGVAAGAAAGAGVGAAADGLLAYISSGGSDDTASGNST